MVRGKINAKCVVSKMPKREMKEVEEEEEEERERERKKEREREEKMRRVVEGIHVHQHT